MTKGWQILETRVGEDRVRRYRVPGGWLYQVERIDQTPPQGSHDRARDSVCGWHPAVFVPAADEDAKQDAALVRDAYVVPPRPPRTGYRSIDGEYHPSPGSPEYNRHAQFCKPCLVEQEAERLERERSPLERTVADCVRRLDNALYSKDGNNGVLEVEMVIRQLAVVVGIKREPRGP